MRFLPLAPLLLLVAPLHADDVEFLLQGIDEIAIPGVPGLLTVHGDRAFPVIAAPTGSSPAPIMAAARSKRGRIVIFGHNFFGKTLSHKGNARLLLNTFAWAGRGTRVGVRRAPILRKLLDAIPLDGPRWLDKLEQLDAIYLPATRLDPTEINAVRRFIENGGGMVTGIPGWGWQQLNPKRDLARDNPANQLIAPMGVVYGRGTMRVAKNRKLKVRPAPPLTHAARALDALRKNGKSPLAVDTLTRAVADLPDTILLRKLAPLRSRRVKLPVGPTLDKVALMLQTRAIKTTPPEKTTAHPTAATFPGSVGKTAPRITKTIEIDLAVPGWHSTGLYAAPGELIRTRTAAKGLRIRIGCHKDRLWNKKRLRRAADITREFETPGPAANAFGGLVYVVVPKNRRGAAAIEIAGAVEAPLFVLGKTSDWKNARNHAGPWAELATDKVIITVPSVSVRKLDDPEALMRFWNKVMDACADLATIPQKRTRPERYVADIQISAGYMHAGYPIMTHLDAAKRFVDLEHLTTKGDWGMFHEMGHNHQHRDWTFGGTVEVTCNLFSLYVLETVVKTPQGHKATSNQSTANWIARYQKAGRPFAMWKSSPFLALVMYRQLKDAFGWKAYKKVFAEYRDLPKSERPKTDAQKRDQWMVRFSMTVGKNLGPFFEWWNVPVSAEAKRTVAHLPKWMPAAKN